MKQFIRYCNYYFHLVKDGDWNIGRWPKDHLKEIDNYAEIARKDQQQEKFKHRPKESYFKLGPIRYSEIYYDGYSRALSFGRFFVAVYY